MSASVINTVPSADAHWWERNFELLIAVLLGIASVVTAYATFQASLYDGETSTLNTRAGMLSAEAESQYLEGNQQFLRDGQLFDRLTELSVDAGSADAALATAAQDKIDILTFQSVTPDFAAAIDWAIAENVADPDTYTHPQDSEEYLAALFGGYQDTSADAAAAVAMSAAYNERGDQLTLNAVLLAISLFLLGIAAILRTARTRIVITAVATALLVVATVLTAIVVATPATA